MASKKNRIIASGLDAGASTARCVILQLEDGRMRFLGYGEAPARGWDKSLITNAAAVSEGIQYAVRAAEQMARLSIQSVVTGVGGASILGSAQRGASRFGQCVLLEQGDLDSAMHRATRIRQDDDRCVLSIHPMGFMLDGVPGFTNPLRMTCSELEAHAQIVTCSYREHQSIMSAVHQAHLEVDETVFEPIAAGYASVLPEDRAKGVAVIDIGAQSSGLAIYAGEMLMGVSTIALGGDHFSNDLTEDLAKNHELMISFEEAVQLKEQFGCAIQDLGAANSYVEVRPSSGRGARAVSRRDLCFSLEMRAEDLFDWLEDRIHRAGMEKHLLEGVVLTGNGALLNGLCEKAEARLNRPARAGLTLDVEDWPKELDTPAWTTAAGLAMYSARLKHNKEPKRGARSWAGDVFK